jgi:mRNA interferase HigB
MQIIGKEQVDSACEKHREWCPSLRRWLKIMEDAQWRNFTDIRQTFGSASRVTPQVTSYVIFNIASNKARLLTVIDYEDKIVAVDDVLTHADYDRKDLEHARSARKIRVEVSGSHCD